MIFFSVVKFAGFCKKDRSEKLPFFSGLEANILARFFFALDKKNPSD
jgi:hypothetical protein